MNTISYEFRPLPNFHYMVCGLPPESLVNVKKEIDDILLDSTQAMNINHDLAGNIAKQYELIDSRIEMEQTLLPLVKQYVKSIDPVCWVMSNEFMPQDIDKLKLKSLWVNYQKKYEFNPPHFHEGLISFALWIKIPYTVQEELEFNKEIATNKNQAGLFTFQYNTALGNLNNIAIPADKTFEGQMVIFPAKLHHSVNPFYSVDGYRISVSGNFVIGEYDE